MPPKIKLNLKKSGTKQQQANANKFLQEKQARQQREQEDKKAAAQLYETFVESFEKGGRSDKTQFVRGGTINSQDTVQNVFGMGEDDDEDDEGGGAGSSGRQESSTTSDHRSSAKQTSDRDSTETWGGQKSSGGSEMDRMMQEMKQRVADPRASRGSESRNQRSSSPKQQQSARSTKRPPRAEKKGKTREIDKLMEEIKESSPADASGKPHTVTTASGRKITLPEGDPNSTNIYVGNLAPTVTEEYLSKKFGKFGDLISVKVMWPRNEEEKARGRNTGFVAFDTREQAIDAMKSMWDSEIAGQTLKLGWGKPIAGARGASAPGSVNPHAPRAGKRRSSERSRSRSSSGESSSRQNRHRDRDGGGRRRSRSRSSSRSRSADRDRKRRRSESSRRRSSSSSRSDDERSPSRSSKNRIQKKRKRTRSTQEEGKIDKEKAEYDRLYGGPEMPSDALRIHVQPPEDALRRRHIDRLALYVSKDGQALEDLFISSEHEQFNAYGTYNFGFLIDKNTPEGIYYRWKTISLLMGDSVNHWRTKPFQLTVGGPWWIPPPLPTEQGGSKSKGPEASQDTCNHSVSQSADDKNNEINALQEDADPRMVEDKAYREGSTVDPQPPQVLPPSSERYKKPRNLMGANQALEKLSGTKSKQKEPQRDSDNDAETDINEAWDSGHSWSASDSDCPQNEGDGYPDEESMGDVPHGYTLLTQKEFRKFVRKLRRVNLARDSVRDGMVWALEHASKARSIVDMIRQSMIKRTAPAPTKVARLYLLNDILHNSTASVRNASVYRNAIEDILPVAFEELGWTLRKLYKYAGRITAEAMKNRIQRVLRRWESIGVFPPLFLHGLEASLLWRPDAELSDEEWKSLDESTLNLEDIKQKCKQAGQQTEGLSSKAMLKRLAWVNQFLKKKFSGFDERPASTGIAGAQNDGWGGANDTETKTGRKRVKKPTKKRRNKYAARAGKGSWVSVDETNDDAEDSSDETDSAVDGVPLDSELDGVPIDSNIETNTQSEQLNSGTLAGENDAMEESSDDDEDIDGVPI